ncbi:hypothetical protein ACFW9F_03070 [Streptomyces sp. NPDC059506]|uniref:hypothetical protein n=1 Tax=Streptomyces sp. NPDC059506 TaxID=3347751 RepID=UPI0036C79A98
MTKAISPDSVPALARAHHAERMRAQLADFWGKPLRGIPHGMDLLRTMYITVTAMELTHDAALVYLDLCDNNAAAYRTSDVWVAPPGMGERITSHPFLNSDTMVGGNLEDIARARDGLVYFPTPIHLDGLHPLYGLAWHMRGTGHDLVVDFETITTTRLIPTRLPPMLAATTPLPRTPYCPNGLATLSNGILNGYSNYDLFGAPGPATTLALLLAFWDLRRPTTAPDALDDEDAADEDIVSVPQYTSTRATTRRKSKRNNRPTRKRRIRIIREPVHTSVPAATDGHARPRDDDSGPKWKDDTLRWEVSEKWQNRCLNPRQHRAIIEAGGECKPVRVRVKEHTNGPKGRAVDPRRTVRIVPDRP